MKPKEISFPDWEILKKKYPDNLKEIIKKIDNGYPVQYLIGNVEFFNTIINVNENVLIPRFETENLVAKTINYAQDIFKNPIEIIDLGTGSGCIAIALKKNLNCKVTALDISKSALKLAKINAFINNENIIFLKQDMLKKLQKDYDIIISNPPYIAKNGFVEKKVLENEPHLALFAKDNGLYYLKNIIKKHLNNLNTPGIMALEIGDHQVSDLEEFLEKLNISNYQFEKDLAGMPRYLFIFK